MITITIDGPTASDAEGVLNKTMQALKEQGVVITLCHIRPGTPAAEHCVRVEDADKVTATVSVPWHGTVSL